MAGWLCASIGYRSGLFADLAAKKLAYHTGDNYPLLGPTLVQRSAYWKPMGGYCRPAARISAPIRARVSLGGACLLVLAHRGQVSSKAGLASRRWRRLDGQPTMAGASTWQERGIIALFVSLRESVA